MRKYCKSHYTMTTGLFKKGTVKESRDLRGHGVSVWYHKFTEKRTGKRTLELCLLHTATIALNYNSEDSANLY